MYNLTYADVFLLAASESPENRLEEIYKARWNRAVEIGKLSVSGGVAILTTLLAAAWHGELNNRVLAWLAVVFAFGYLGYGAWQFSRISRLQRRQLVALRHLHASRNILRAVDAGRARRRGGGAGGDEK